MRAATGQANAKLLLAIGLTFIAALFVAPPVLAGVPVPASVDHHISADGHHDHLASVDHEHIGPAANPGMPDSFGETTAPRVRTALVALGVVLAAALLCRIAPRTSPAVGRGPPRAPVVVLSGRDLLSRLCIIRR